VTLLTGLAVGLVPALSVSRGDMQGTLRDEGRGTSETRRARHFRGLLVAGQIALCVSLLAGAGLLARSLWALMAAPLGIVPEGIVAVTVQLPPGRTYNNGEARASFIEQVERRLRTLPGVVAVSAAGDIPTRVLNRNGYAVEGVPVPSDGALPWALYESVSDDYFRTLRIPVRAGRVFGPRDHAEAPPVVIVSEGLARRHWPGESAVGKRLRPGPEGSPWYEVVGVVADVVNDAARLAPDPATYVALRQAPWNGPIFLVRSSGDVPTLAGAVRRTIAEVDPSVPLRDMSPLPALLADGFAHRRLPVLLMTGFGALALLLASVGVYALFASMAAAREREFGVRVALGSTPARIAGLVLRQGGTWMALGLAGGALGVVAVARLLRGLLYGVAPFDPATLAVAVLLLLACAVVAVLGPVRRATRVDPITVLR
jgi:putative ABC transport system permease protein